MTTARVALECIALAALLYAACFVVGWWLWHLCADQVRGLSVWTGAPIAGLAVALIVSHYWASHGGLDVIATWIVAGAFVLDAVLLARAVLTSRVTARSLRSVRWPAGIAAGVALLFCWHHLDVLRIGRLSTGSLFLADLPNFTIIGEYLGRQGFGEAGSIVGYDLGALAAGTPGSSAFISLASAWTGRPAFEASLPAALLCVVLIAFAARDLGRAVVPWSQLIPALLAVAASSAPILVYATAQYALSQLLAMPAAIAFLVVVADAALRETRVTARRCATAAICLAPIVLGYPHMAVLAPPLLVGIALAAAIGHGWLRRCTSALAVALGAVGIVFVALPRPTITSFDRAVTLSEADAGFPMGLLTPLDLLGFRGSFVGYTGEPNAVALFVIEALVIAAFVVLVFVAAEGKSRSRVGLAGAATLVSLASYAAVLLTQGASYEQWKWASFFVPIFVVGLGATVAWACRLVAQRRAVGRRVALVAGVAVMSVVLVSGAVFAHEATSEFVGDSEGHEVNKGWELVDPDLITMASGPAYRGVGAVNVQLPTYWETSWAAYFLAPRRTFLSSGVGIASVAPLADWTLERHDEPLSRPPGTDVRVVNARYRLVRERPDRVDDGTIWIVDSCDGVYRFDGARWVAAERTPKTGGYELTMQPARAAPGTRFPVVVHARSSAVDALILELLPRGRARFVTQHSGAGWSSRDRRLPDHRELRHGKAFSLTPGRPIELSAVFDPITGEERVEQGGVTLLDARSTFAVPRTLGKVRIGADSSGLALAQRKFRGTLEVADRSTPVCSALIGEGAPGRTGDGAER